MKPAASENASHGLRSKRGRPSRKQAEAIDLKILDSARACFLAGGFRGTSIEAIADHARVSKVTLYLRYADKAALLRAVLEERLATWSKAASQVRWATGDTLEARLKHYARSLLRWSRSEEVRAFDRLLQSSWETPDPLARELQQLLKAPMLSILERDIAGYGARDARPVGDPRRIASLFMGMLRGFLELAQVDDADESALVAFADQAVMVLIHGREAW